MGKVAQIKGDLDDVEAIIEIISILKDVSTNKFFAFAQRKTDFGKFLELFLVFFNMLQSVETSCPLVRNNIPGTDIVVITSESSFMAQLNGRVCNAALKESQKYPDSKIICVGWRGVDKCKSLGMKVERVYRDVEQHGRYEISLNIRDFLIDRIMSGQSGRAICVYIWAKSFNVLKPRVVTMLPAEELLGGSQDEEDGQGGGEKEKASQVNRRFIQESSIDGIMKMLADIWISCRLFEILVDTQLAEAASQAQQLESSIEGLSKEKSGLMLSFKKAMRGDLNKAMTEVFTSSKVIRSNRRAA
jgi:F0F1-type ATP synthase gamma subunit